MGIFKAAALGVSAALLALWLKKDKPEYGIYLSLAAGIMIFGLVVSKLETAADTILQIASYISVDLKYIMILLKVIGIAYICEFSANVCKDSGYATIAAQIELAGKISILVMSLPVMTSVLDMIENFLK